ncbi:DUF3456 domain-containing protein [Chloropicon primus]|uniref:DUF3456 domain-containing protein n=1 Tax=Chloropicon primus TaxID=1764295 RepID=A0A5B8MS65_9CHLO|nr:hypothetical protein A3770_10p59570 [Chloropicon primus]UPR02651.1 DUF3456 domain-containing protein [Chloropicon primus]|eukprot:QDZ23439.1 hypothetical protein A3770_10p59570 [Chloropicon primus]
MSAGCRIQGGSLVLLLLLAGLGVALGIESKCSANAIIAEKLWSRLEAETGTKELDLTHRLDSKGGRLGRKIAYKDSELRYVELLEDFCEKLPVALPLRREDGEPSWVVVGRSPEYEDLAEKQFPHKHAKEEMATVLGNHCFAIVDDHEDSITDLLKGEDWVGNKQKGGFVAAFLGLVAPQCREGASQKTEL